MGKREDIIKLGIDIAKGTVASKYSSYDADEALRMAFKELEGFSKDGKIDKKVFRKSSAEIFEILEEILDNVIEIDLRNELEGFVEYRNLALGDTIEFVIPRKNVYNVAVVSDSNGNLRRQRVRGGDTMKMETSTYGVKIYEEFLRFLAGRINWVEMIRDVAESFAQDVKERIYKVLLAHFQENGSEKDYRLTVSGAVPTEREILTMAKHIEASTGQTVTIYGTALALNQLELKEPSDDDLRRKNAQGYLGTIAGIPTKEIKAFHKANTRDFAIEDNFIILVPEGRDQMIKVVNEGESWIVEDNQGNNVDRTMEYLVVNKFGISVMPTSIYGFIKFNA